MNTFILLILAFTIISKVFGQQCGINDGGVITQQLTNEPLTSSEGLFYDVDANELYFVDRYKPALCCIHGKTALFHRIEIPGIKYITVAIPIKNVKDKMIGLADNKLIYLYLQRDSKGKINKITTEDIEKIEEDKECSITFSKVDQKGRLWIDMAILHKSHDKKGKLLQIQKDKSIKEILEHDKLPRGIGFSPDNKMFFHADSVLNVVTKYDLNINAGTISKPEVIFNVSKEWYFDGYVCSLTVAKDNTLWLGLCETGVLIQYNWQKKQFDQMHKLPSLYPVSLEFGGPNLDVLFVGSENIHCDDTPAAGAVFAISGTGSKGTGSYKMQK